jgi:hypothetical protein
MLADREVTGKRWRVDLIPTVTGFVVGAVEPAEAPPVFAARAASALVPSNKRLQTSAQAVRTCKSKTSFVGLRG